MNCCTFILTLFLAIASSCTADQATRSKLVTDLMHNFDKAVESTNTNLTLSIALICGRYCEFTKKFWTSTWDKYEWEDNRLRWDSEDYGGITEIRLGPDLLSKPDIRLFNALNAKIQHGHVKMIVKNDGRVLWFPPVLYETHCELKSDGNITCPYKLSSWTYDNRQLPLLKGDPDVSLEFYDSHCPFLAEVKKSDLVVKTYACCIDEFVTWEFEVNYTANPDFE